MAILHNQDSEGRGEDMAQVAASLHAMCQPLTALQCRLELGQLTFRFTTDTLLADCLHECNRLTASVLEMRQIIQQAVVRDENR